MFAWDPVRNMMLSYNVQYLQDNAATSKMHEKFHIVTKVIKLKIINAKFT